MSEVRLRARLARSRRVREIQGMLAIQGLEGEAEHEATAVMERPASALTIPYKSGGRPSATLDAVRPLPYRTVLADWPDEWRERWGRRANELEDSGLSWRDAEGRAFLEIWNQLRATTQVERN
jgi:hypothetical protein